LTRRKDLREGGREGQREKDKKKKRWMDTQAYYLQPLSPSLPPSLLPYPSLSPSLLPYPSLSSTATKSLSTLGGFLIACEGGREGEREGGREGLRNRGVIRE